ncbi:MAG TPA: hypothetical protein VM243_02710 [Phycisphaerae bacterium]|nr:hypothetical protein [Phycisphaerae bacterium]
MPLTAQLLTQEIGVETLLASHEPRLLTEEIGVETVLASILPRLLTQNVGVSTTLPMATESLDPLTQTVGVECSLIFTLPTDTRTTWVSVVQGSQTECPEVLPLVRTKQVKVSEYGRLTIYGRQFVVPRGNTGQAILETLLAPGAHMQDIWADEWFSRAIDGPKVSDVGVQQYFKDEAATGSDVAAVTFVAIKTLDPVLAGAYCATARYMVSRDAFGETYVEWGIAASMATTGVPMPGTVLKGFGGVYSPKCVQVDPNDTVLPGRWLIKSTYRRKLANPFILKPVSVEDVFTQSGVVSIRKRTTAKTSTGGMLGKIHF